MTCNDNTFNADACYDQDGYRPDGSKVIYDYKQVHILFFAAFSLHIADRNQSSIEICNSISMYTTLASSWTK